MMNKKKKLSIVLAILSLLLVACGSDDFEPSTTYNKNNGVINIEDLSAEELESLGIELEELNNGREGLEIQIIEIPIESDDCDEEDDCTIFEFRD